MPGTRAYRVGAGAANQSDHRLHKPGHLRAKTQFSFQVLFVGDGIQMAPHRFRPTGGASPFQKISLHLAGEGRLAEPVSENVAYPFRLRTARTRKAVTDV